MEEVRSLVGKLLHLSEVVRPGKFFVRRILNKLGLTPFSAGATADKRFVARRTQRRGRVRLGPEFHDDLAFWRLILDMATGVDGVTRLEAPLSCCFLQSPSLRIISDARGDSMGGYYLETGKW